MRGFVRYVLDRELHTLLRKARGSNFVGSDTMLRTGHTVGSLAIAFLNPLVVGVLGQKRCTLYVQYLQVSPLIPIQSSRLRFD